MGIQGLEEEDPGSGGHHATRLLPQSQLAGGLSAPCLVKQQAVASGTCGGHRAYETWHTEAPRTCMAVFLSLRPCQGGWTFV